LPLIVQLVVATVEELLEEMHMLDLEHQKTYTFFFLDLVPAS